MARGLDPPTVPILSRLFVADQRNLPLMGFFGRDEGMGGFAGKSHPTCVALLPDEQRAVTSENDNPLKLWDLRTGALLHVFPEYTKRGAYVAVSPDGHRLLSASFDKSVAIWDLDKLSLINAFNQHTSDVFVVAFAPDGHHALS